MTPAAVRPGHNTAAVAASANDPGNTNGFSPTAVIANVVTTIGGRAGDGTLERDPCARPDEVVADLVGRDDEHQAHDPGERESAP